MKKFRQYCENLAENPSVKKLVKVAIYLLFSFLVAGLLNWSIFHFTGEQTATLMAIVNLFLVGAKDLLQGGVIRAKTHQKNKK